MKGRNRSPQAMRSRTPVKGAIFYADVNGKNRPVIIVEAKGDSVRYLKCTTKEHECNSPYRLTDMRGTGLDDTSFVNRGSTYVMSRSKLTDYRGKLSKNDMAYLKPVLNGKGQVSSDIYDEAYQRMMQQRYDW